MKDLILDLKARGKTVFLSSHLLADVQAICDRIGIIHEGKLKEYGAVRDILVRRDHVALTFRNLGDETRRKLVDIAKQEGAELISADNTLETLEDVFLRTVQGAKKPPS
jgi:ABC-2 type transport system ATP-binding protein